MSETADVFGNSQLFHKSLTTISQEIAPYWKIKGDLERLNHNLEWIHALALDTEKVQQRDDNNYVRKWLRNLKKVAYDADDLFDDFSYELQRRQFEKDNMLLKVKDLFTSSNRLVSRTIMAYRVKDLRDKLKFFLDDNTILCKDGYYYTTKSNTQERGTLDIRGCFDKIVGREKDISNLVDLLIRSPSSFVHIGGMAGLGKTKLARTVYNDESVIGHFQIRIWITLPGVFDLKEVLKKIISSVNKDAKFYESLDLTMMQVEEMLDGKKYLLVLDNFWDLEDSDNCEWLNIILKFGSHGSKILLTSRKTNVAWNVRRITTTYHMQPLSTDECWSIIKGRISSGKDVEMVNIGKDVAKKCRGLPLAARISGYILENAKKLKWDLIRKADIIDNAEFCEKMYQTLKLSYDHLPSSALKQCFSYCSIFPRGYEIDREEIIQLWMAEGFLVPSSREGEMEDIGNEYFDSLLSDSLFETVENKDDIQKCKLHDFVHYLARTIAGYDGCSISTAKNVVVSDSETRRLVFDEDMPKMLPDVGKYKNRLRTVVSLEAGDCDNIQNVFRNRNMRVIYLRGSSIQKVPASLSKLRHLRYLNLSGCQNLDVLDDQSTNNLYNLQTLVLRNCTSLSKLPEGIGSMRSLRHLDISNTKIKVLPTSVTSLQNLRTLNVSNCPDFEELPENIGSLKNLRSLDISHTKVSKLPDSTRDLEKLEKLRLHSCPNLKDFPNGIEGLVLPEVLNLRERL